MVRANSIAHASSSVAESTTAARSLVLAARMCISASPSIHVSSAAGHTSRREIVGIQREFQRSIARRAGCKSLDGSTEADGTKFKQFRIAFGERHQCQVGYVRLRHRKFKQSQRSPRLGRGESTLPGNEDSFAAQCVHRISLLVRDAHAGKLSRAMDSNRQALSQIWVGRQIRQ